MTLGRPHTTLTQAPLPARRQALQQTGRDCAPAFFAAAGESAVRRFVEFFTAEIRNPNTRAAYALAARRFAAWCDKYDTRLEQLTPVEVATYVEQLGKGSNTEKALSKPSVKQHLAALRMLFDYLVVKQIIPHNPAASVRGPKYVIKKGKTPVLAAEEARALFDSIDCTVDESGRKVPKEAGQLTIGELRDRALIGVMVYSFARIGAVLGMNVEDYCQQGKRSWFRLHEKGGKHHEVPAHRKAEEYLDAYLAAAGIAGQKGTPLFRTLDRRGRLTARRLESREALAMVKRRCRRAGLGDRICCHSFRATGITVFLLNGGTVERAQQIAAHESPRTTKLYDRTNDQLSLDDIARIQF
jgi:site-specific recombinase XerD